MENIFNPYIYIYTKKYLIPPLVLYIKEQRQPNRKLKCLNLYKNGAIFQNYGSRLHFLSS